jgi:Na+/proline symporter
MSDIGIIWQVQAELCLILGAPGFVLGIIAGAFAWRRHRIWGAVIGAVLGFIVSLTCVLLWLAYMP